MIVFLYDCLNIVGGGCLILEFRIQNHSFSLPHLLKLHAHQTFNHQGKTLAGILLVGKLLAALGMSQLPNLSI